MKLLAIFVVFIAVGSISASPLLGLGDVAGTLTDLTGTLSGVTGTIGSALAPVLTIVTQLVDNLQGLLNGALNIADLCGLTTQIASTVDGLAKIISGLAGELVTGPVGQVLIDLTNQVNILLGSFNILKTVLGGLLEQVRFLLATGIENVVPLIENILGKVINQATELIQNAISILTTCDGLNVAKEVLGKLLAAVQGALQTALGVVNNLSKLLQGLGCSVGVLSDLVSALQDAIKTLNSLISNIKRLSLREVIRLLRGILSPLTNLAIRVVKPVVASVENVIKGLSGVLNVELTFNLSGPLQSLLGEVNVVLENAFGAISKLLRELNLDALVGAVDFVRQAVEALITVILSLSANALANGVNVNGILDAINYALFVLVGGVQCLNNVAEGIIGQVSSQLAGAIQKIVKTVLCIVGPILTVVTENVLASLANTIAESGLLNIVDSLIPNILSDFLSGILNSLTGTGVTDVLTDALNTVTGLIGNTLNGALGTVSGVLSSLPQIGCLGGVGQILGSVIPTLFGLTGNISGITNNVLEGIQFIVANLLGFINAISCSINGLN